MASPNHPFTPKGSLGVLYPGGAAPAQRQTQLPMAKVKAGLISDGSQALSGTAAIQLAAPKKPARLLDVSNFVTDKFSGEGEAKAALTSFRTWRATWESAVRHMRDKCSGFEHEILFPKMRSTLEGPAAELVSTIPPESAKSYDEALQKLERKYGDPIALAAAYVADIHRLPHDKSPESCHNRIKDGFIQLGALVETIEEEEISLLDFFIIQGVLTGLPAATQNHWRAHIIDLEQAHSAKDSGTPWRQGKAFNRQTFIAWHESFAMKNKDASSVGADVFLATGTPKSSGSRDPAHPGCVLHGPTSKHGTLECKAVEWADTKKWIQLTRDAQVCGKCLEPWTQDHFQACSAKCSRCQGHHHTIRCGKDGKGANAASRKRPPTAVVPSREGAPQPKQARDGGNSSSLDRQMMEQIMKSIQTLVDRPMTQAPKRQNKPAPPAHRGAGKKTKKEKK